MNRQQALNNAIQAELLIRAIVEDYEEERDVPIETPGVFIARNMLENIADMIGDFRCETRHELLSFMTRRLFEEIERNPNLVGGVLDALNYLDKGGEEE